MFYSFSFWKACALIKSQHNYNTLHKYQHKIWILTTTFSSYPFRHFCIVYYFCFLPSFFTLTHFCCAELLFPYAWCKVGELVTWFRQKNKQIYFSSADGEGWAYLALMPSCAHSQVSLWRHFLPWASSKLKSNTHLSQTLLTSTLVPWSPWLSYVGLFPICPYLDYTGGPGLDTTLHVWPH